LLSAPADNHGRAGDTVLEVLEPRLAQAGGEVGAYHPQEWPTGELQTLGQLLELARVEDGHAAEGHVHDGAGRPRVEPFEATHVLRKKVADGFLEGPIGEERRWAVRWGRA
jgi:hypothetical protein